MRDDNFKSISLLGRISYGIMCAEKYAIEKAPEKNWIPLFERLWSITGGEIYWDAWGDQIVELLPECLFDSDEYSPSDFEHLTEPEFREMRQLSSGMPGEWNTLLKRIHDMEDVYAYTSISDEGASSLVYLQEVVNILRSNGIDLPDWKKVSFSKFSECNGRGNSFDFRERGLSEIIR
jgi:hypothetical protein